MPERLRVSGRSVALAVAVVGATLLVLRILTSAHRVIVWFLIAAALAGLLHPFVERLRRRLPRGLAVAVVALVTIGTVAGVAYALVGDLVRQTRTLQAEAPRLAADLERSGRFREFAREADLSERTRRFVEQVPERLRGGTPAEAVRSATTRGLAVLAVTVLTLFLVLHGPKLVAAAARQVHDDERRAAVERVAGAAWGRAFRYARGTVGTAVLAGAVAYGLARAAGLPGPVPLAVWVALWDAVPLLGAVVGGLPLVGLAVAIDPARGLALAAAFVAYQVFEDLVVQRRLERGSVRVGPFLTAAGGFAGLELYGLAGALLAVLGLALLAAALDESFPAGTGTPSAMDTSDKHSPRMDDELQKDTRAGADVRESRRMDDSRPDVAQRQPGVMDDADADRRAELARSIEPTVFPARPAQLLDSARASFAPDWVVRSLASLPDQQYDNTQSVWAALGGPVEEKRA